MSKGGARNRSGPPADPASLRTAARGLTFRELPREGYDGEVPEFPLPQMSRYRWEYEDKRRFQVYDADATNDFRERELDVWAEAWTTPQAVAWRSEDWRWPVLAEYCRIKTAIELDPDTPAALVGQLHRYRDQLGLTPAGLRENGWTLARVDVGPATKSSTESAERRPSARDRLKVVGGDE